MNEMHVSRHLNWENSFTRSNFTSAYTKHIGIVHSSLRKSVDFNINDISYLQHPYVFHALVRGLDISNASIKNQIEKHTFVSDCLKTNFTGKFASHPNLILDFNFSLSDKNKCLEKLYDSIGYIKKHSDITFRFVRLYCQLICFANSNVKMVSSSQRDYIGRVLLINVKEICMERVVSALIHEAIHNYLFCLEHSSRFLSRNRIKTKLESPWSGKEIPDSAFVHACYVWYGLYNFWKSIDSVRANEISLGFFSKTYNDNVNSIASYNSVHTKEDLLSLKDLINVSV